MATLSMNEITTFRWSFEEDVAQYSAAGIPAIAVWREKLSDCGQQKAVELLAASGMQVSCVQWAGGFTGSDGRSFRSSIEDAMEALALTAALKAPALVVYSGDRACHTYNHARRLFKDALQILAPRAAEMGVSLAVEPMHPGCAAEFTFLTSVDDVVDLLEAVGHPHVKLVFDFYHLGQDGKALDRIGQLVPYTAIVQLGDAISPPRGEQDRCRLGEGHIPLAEIVAALKAGGYDGYYDVELLGESLGPRDYADLLQHAKSAFQHLVGSDA